MTFLKAALSYELKTVARIDNADAYDAYVDTYNTTLNKLNHLFFNPTTLAATDVNQNKQFVDELRHLLNETTEFKAAYGAHVCACTCALLLAPHLRVCACLWVCGHVVCYPSV